MTTHPGISGASQQAAVDAALLILERMGHSPDNLAAAPRNRTAIPTFADYVPVVSATVTSGTLKAYRSYWNRVVEQWGARRLDELAMRGLSGQIDAEQVAVGGPNGSFHRLLSQLGGAPHRNVPAHGRRLGAVTLTAPRPRVPHPRSPVPGHSQRAGSSRPQPARSRQ